MTIIDAGDYVFKYDHGLSVNQNFENWRMLNAEERSAWGEPQLTRDDAKDLFETQYSVKITVDK